MNATDPLHPVNVDRTNRAAINQIEAIGLHCARCAVVAISDHGLFNSAHETYAVLAEEMNEYWDEVKKKRALRSPELMIQELEDIAAVCIKAIHQLQHP